MIFFRAFIEIKTVVQFLFTFSIVRHRQRRAVSIPLVLCIDYYYERLSLIVLEQNINTNVKKNASQAVGYFMGALSLGTIEFSTLLEFRTIVRNTKFNTYRRVHRALKFAGDVENQT